MTLSQFWYVLVACFFAFIITVVVALLLLDRLLTRAILRRIM